MHRCDVKMQNKQSSQPILCAFIMIYVSEQIKLIACMLQCCMLQWQGTIYHSIYNYAYFWCFFSSCFGHNFPGKYWPFGSRAIFPRDFQPYFAQPFCFGKLWPGKLWSTTVFFTVWEFFFQLWSFFLLALLQYPMISENEVNKQLFKELFRSEFVFSIGMHFSYQCRQLSSLSLILSPILSLSLTISLLAAINILFKRSFNFNKNMSFFPLTCVTHRPAITLITTIVIIRLYTVCN